MKMQHCSISVTQIYSDDNHISVSLSYVTRQLCVKIRQTISNFCATSGKLSWFQ